jgi:4-hydroxybenzoate polyprenyltransferase
MRELPSGRMSRAEAIAFVAVSTVLFVAAAWMVSPLCGALAPVAIGIVFWYSLAKRFTNYAQIFLGLSMAVAPVGGWIAMGGPLNAAPFLLGLAIGTWVAGFDILYACQDLDVDRREGLRSIPVKFGIAGSLMFSRVLHVITIASLAGVGLVLHLNLVYMAGVCIWPPRSGRCAHERPSDCGRRDRRERRYLCRADDRRIAGGWMRARARLQRLRQASDAR